MAFIEINFGHHISLSYRGGGEKWVTQLANELSLRGHKVSVHALPVWRRDNPVELLPEVDYKEGYFHTLNGDINYLTYNPLSGINFKVKGPKIAGIHSHCYWQPFALRYGFLPNLANFVHMITKRWDLEKYDAIHIVTSIYYINHRNVYFIPNFVDNKLYSPTGPKYNEFTIGFSSRKCWQKGFDIFLKLKNILSDIRFVETNNIPEMGMPQFYSQNHLTIVPARVDTFGLSIVESMLCKTPVLSSGLDTHKSLQLPIRYAQTIDEYIKEIEILRDMFETEAYRPLMNDCRKSALKFDKDIVIDQLETMFMRVGR